MKGVGHGVDESLFRFCPGAECGLGGGYAKFVALVLAEFWATWCGPCIDAIAHLNALQEKYGGKRFQLLSFVQEGHPTMDRFVAKRTVKYPIGLESTSLDDYGITGIPHAFLINRNGNIVWHGHSSSPEMEKAIEAELGRAD